MEILPVLRRKDGRIVVLKLEIHEMEHLGDITKLSGYNLPPVDVVIGGSPCQDLSVAGNRAGLAGERSGLFMEQIRLVKELRNADRKRGRTDFFVRPRFIVWENVPGAFSSNKGKDFRRVLEETARIADPEAPDIPLPDKWPMADAYYGNGWSVAYRVLDVQFWGIPQRRRRIALVADFGGLSAPEILFVRKGLSWDSPEGGTAREGATGAIEDGTYPTIARSLAARYDGSPCIDRGPNIIVQCAYTPRDATGRNSPLVYDARGNGDGNVCCTLTGDHQNRITDYTALCIGNVQVNCITMAETANTLTTMHDHQAVMIACDVVRRLTPLECERLQGYPDNWTDIGDWVDSKGKKHKSADSPRYRALGNSIALPPWKWVLKRLSAQYERDATMGSLFDGIGGFPYLWEQINGKGTALWASEIEEFPIAVTKAHFPS